MGQSSSRQEPASPQRHSRPRSSLLRPSSMVEPLLTDSAPASRSHRHSTFFGSLAPRTTPTQVDGQNDSSQSGPRRRSRVFRSYTSRSNLPNPFTRHAPSPSLRSEPIPESPTSTETSNLDAPLTTSSSQPPQLETPAFDHSLDFPPIRRARPLTPQPADSTDQLSTLNSRDPSLSSRWRPRSPFRNHNAAPILSWRRRSPIRRDSEDSNAALHRLLQTAAATTALSLTASNSNEPFDRIENSSRSMEDDDGSFNEFIQSISSGALANSLSRGEGPRAQVENGQGQHASFDFFRMFRFGSSNSRQQRNSTSPRPASSRNPGGPVSTSEPVRPTEASETDRMVSVVIVGIRALSDRDANLERTEGMPSFFDALNGLPTPLGPLGVSPENVAIDGDGEVTPPPRRRSRRSTIAGLSSFLDNAQEQEQSRPATAQPLASESPVGPHPPPTTPASPGLSALSSGTNTPTRRSSMSSFTDLVGSQSRRSSMYRRLTGTALEPTLEEQQMMPEAAHLRPRGLRRRPRIASWADGSRHDPRRNGVLMEPSSETPNENSSTRSWVIYILGGNYPENHPIVTAPSLFTDSPNYEDMILLQNLLGPVKPPVAHAEDVASAGGLYKIVIDEDSATASQVDGEDSVRLSLTEQCLVCLAPYQDGEEVRRLAKCKHMYHRECIDQWLTTGRNSCPLCRSQGVDEKDRTTDETQTSPGADESGIDDAVARLGAMAI